jgi:hypothetical protein
LREIASPLRRSPCGRTTANKTHSLLGQICPLCLARACLGKRYSVSTRVVKMARKKAPTLTSSRRRRCTQACCPR